MHLLLSALTFYDSTAGYCENESKHTPLSSVAGRLGLSCLLRPLVIDLGVVLLQVLASFVDMARLSTRELYSSERRLGFHYRKASQKILHSSTF